ncbi:MAG: hypothetical protein QXH79_05410 [Candidatus Bathyarchaeia archaeon]
MERVTWVIPCILVLSILAYIPLATHAYQGGVAYRLQGKGDEKLEQIIDLAEKARIRANVSLQIAQNLGFDISRLREMYNLGLQLMNRALGEGNYSYALQAMNAFRECIRNSTKMIAEDKSNISMGWIGLTVAVNRLEEFVERVNESAEALEAYGVDVSSVENLLKEVNDTIAEIKSLLADGNVSGAAKLLGDARAKAAEALATLKIIAHSERIMARRMEKYIDKFEEARSRIYDKLRGIPHTIRERIGLKLNEIESLLNEVRSMIRNRVMDKAMNRIIEMHRRYLDIIGEVEEG